MGHGGSEYTPEGGGGLPPRDLGVMSGRGELVYKEAAMKLFVSILTRRALRSCCRRLVVADCGHVDGGHGGGIGEEHEAWAVSLQRLAGRLATPLGHIKKKKMTIYEYGLHLIIN